MTKHKIIGARNGRDMTNSIVKRFPKGYIIHNDAMMQKETPRECWMIVDHFGRNDAGLEVFIAVTGRCQPTMADAISEMKWVRDGIHD